MKKRLMMALAAGALVAAMAPGVACAQDQTAVPSAEPEGPRYLIVLNGTSGSMSGGSLSLDGVPSVIYFSDRPERIAGHSSLADFAAIWDAGADSFADDPPNAAISVLGSEQDLIVEITRLEVEDGTVLDVVALEGTLPDGDIGPTALFIDDGAYAGQTNGSTRLPD